MTTLRHRPVRSRSGAAARLRRRLSGLGPLALRVAVGLAALLTPILSLADPATAPLPVLRSIGLDDDGSIVLHSPIDLNWHSNGLAYVLNQGDGRIVAFSEEWKPVHTFGGLGEAPGQYSMPNSLLVLEEEIWVVSPWRATVFSLQGELLRTSPLETQFSSPRYSNGRILATSPSGAQIGLSLDVSSSFLREFGPSCGGGGSMSLADVIRCSDWVALPSAGDDVVLFDLFDGRAYFVGSDGEVEVEVDLGLGRGRMMLEAMKFRSVVGDIRAVEGGFLAMGFPEPGGAAHLWKLDASARVVATRQVSAGVGATQIVVSPSGELCLVDGHSSVIYVCPWPWSEADER